MSKGTTLTLPSTPATMVFPRPLPSSKEVRALGSPGRMVTDGTQSTDPSTQSFTPLTMTWTE